MCVVILLNISKIQLHTSILDYYIFLMTINVFQFFFLFAFTCIIVLLRNLAYIIFFYNLLNKLIVVHRQTNRINFLIISLFVSHLSLF